MKEKTDFFNLSNFKFLAIFLVFLGCLFLSDEGRKPLIYSSTELINKSTESVSLFCTPKFLFNKGSYNFNINFDDIPTNSFKIELWRQSEKLNEWETTPNADYFSTDFSLSADSQDVQFRIIANNQQSTINNQHSTITNPQF